MITLREGLLNKKNIKDIAPSYFTNYKKSDLKTGDVIHLKDGSIGVFIKEKTDAPEYFYYVFNNDKGQGIDLYYEYFEEGKFTYDKMCYKEENLIHIGIYKLSVEKVEPGRCPKNIIKDKSKLWKWFKENY